MRRLGAGVAAIMLGGVLTACGGSLNTAQGGEDCEQVYKARFATNYQPNTAIQDSFEWWTDQVTERTDGCVIFEHFYAEALLPTSEMLPGIGIGQAEAGMVIPVHNPDIAPIGGIHMVPGLGFNHEAHARALGELAATNELFLAEQEELNVKIMAYTNVGAIGIGTKEKVTEASEFNGVQVRSVGSLATLLTKPPFSANPIPLALPEIYQSMERGVIDAYWQLAFDAIPASGLHEIAPWAFYDNVGVYGTPALGLNMDFYESLPQEYKDVMDEVSAEFYEVQTRIISEYEDKACDVLIEAGGGATVISDADHQTWLNSIGDEPVNQFIATATAAGHEQAAAEALVEEFRTLNEKFAAEATYEPGIVRCAERTQKG